MKTKFKVLVAIFAFFIVITYQSRYAFSRTVSTSRNSNVELSVPDEEESFVFAILGDRTTGSAEGLKVLAKAVKEINLFGPDLVLNVGDMVNGYNDREEWLKQMREYKNVVKGLEVPFYPVAGNHDVYWRGKGRPAKEHEEDYEEHFGPLWYWFKQKGSVFIVLFSDEGNVTTGAKSFSDPLAQKMTPEQTGWLKATLKKAKQAKHIFIFLHHPRWTGGGYGDDWDRIHRILKRAGNVSAVFAGHTHVNKYNGKVDGIEYFTLGTTGGSIPEVDPLRGLEHRYLIVNVNEDEFHIAGIPVGNVVNPRHNPIIITPLVEKRGWKVSSDNNRVQKWQVEIPDYKNSKGSLRIGLRHGADDSGDKGIEYRLLTYLGEKVAEGFSDKDGYVWIEHPVKPGEKYTFVIADRDTTFIGRYPGNGGDVKIDLEEIVE